MSGLARLYSVEHKSQILLVIIFRINPIAYISTILSNDVSPASICDDIKILYTSLVIMKLSGTALLLLLRDSRALGNAGRRFSHVIDNKYIIDKIKNAKNRICSVS